MSLLAAARPIGMADPVVHFEIVGADPAALRRYYGELFGWEYEVGDASSTAVSAPGEYGFVHNAGVNGGVAGGAGMQPRVVFYVNVPDVETALRDAERLGGTRVLGPDGKPGTLVIGHFHDPEGNLIGVAGPR
jgi:predicted enzyme related to lactoylglutathione lyase